MIQNNTLTFEKKFYFILLFTIPIFLFCLIKCNDINNLMNQYRQECFFKEYLHFYCIGCGGTRAFIALSKGHFIQSFLYNPIVIVLFIMYVSFIISHTISLFIPDYQGIEIKPIYANIVVIVVTVNFIVRNVLLFLHLPTYL